MKTSSCLFENKYIKFDEDIMEINYNNRKEKISIDNIRSLYLTRNPNYNYKIIRVILFTSIFILALKPALSESIFFFPYLIVLIYFLFFQYHKNIYKLHIATLNNTQINIKIKVAEIDYFDNFISFYSDYKFKVNTSIKQ